MLAEFHKYTGTLEKAFVVHVMNASTRPSSPTESAHYTRRVVTETFFFPLAAGYGALILPLFIFGLRHPQLVPAGLTTPAGHAHELLFGYALAVVTGFLLNRVNPGLLALLVTLWLAARISFLLLPGSTLTVTCNIGFALAVALTAAPRFMKAAKKWRNRLTGPLVIAICMTMVAFQLLSLNSGSWTLHVVLGEAVVLFAMLMLFFGGRLIAPAAAGAIERAGRQLKARVQPRIEGAILITMVAAALATPLPSMLPVQGLLLTTAGILALVRLGRWKLWLCRARSDLLCLGVGYAWLGAGLILVGLARGFEFGIAGASATHAITVGALGTLTCCIMLRTRLLRVRIGLAQSNASFVAMTALMSAATLSRAFATGWSALAMASLAWTAALLILLVSLIRYR